MLSLNKMQEYLQEVCGQIRWKKAREPIAQELQSHILDQQAAFVKQGIDTQQALEKAVAEMGDPVAVGADFDRTYRPKMQWGLMGFVLLLCALGVLLESIVNGNTANLLQSLLTLAVGIGAMLLGNWLDFTLFAKKPVAVYLGFVVVALLVALTPYGVYGRNMAFSPQSFLLLAPLVFAGVIYYMRGQGLLGVLVCGLLFAPLLWLGVYGSLGHTFAAMLAGLVLLTAAVQQDVFACKKWGALLLIYLPVCGVLAAFVQSGFGARRLRVLWNPYLAPEGEGFLGVLLREMLRGAHPIGQGSLANAETLPAFLKEFSLAYLIHTKGWIAGVVLVGLLLALLVWSAVLCFRQKSKLGRLVSAAIVLVFGMQTLIGVVQNVGYSFFSSITLPFVDNSSGTLILNLFLAGILLSVFKTGDLVRDSKKRQADLLQRVHFSQGKLVIDFHRLPQKGCEPPA